MTGAGKTKANHPFREHHVHNKYIAVRAPIETYNGSLESSRCPLHEHRIKCRGGGWVDKKKWNCCLSGNWTRVSTVTAWDTNHYTNKHSTSSDEADEYKLTSLNSPWRNGEESSVFGRRCSWSGDSEESQLDWCARRIRGNMYILILVWKGFVYAQGWIRPVVD